MPPRDAIRQRRFAALAAIAVVAIAIALIARGGSSDAPKRLVPGGGSQSGTYDPLGFDPGKEGELARRATSGFSDVVYEKSPGGVLATARRVARYRGLIGTAARSQGVNADTLEAMVFLESAGRPDAIAGGDVEGAAGLAQIVASTATALLGMTVDLAKSKRLTARIADATTLAQQRRLERARRRIDDRFDPAKAVAAAARYLKLAQDKFGREDLAVATYHMGMGNLETLLSRYESDGGDGSPSYTRLYFDSAPLRRPRAYALLSSLGDDSSNYLWRVRAAQEIMRLSRDDPSRLRRLAELDDQAGAGARRLYPGGAPDDADDASADAPKLPAALGVRFSGRARTDYSPSAGAEAVLFYVAAGTRAISRQAPLTVTGAHGVRIEISRRYRSRKQALAFQFMLDRLQAWNLIAWGRGATTLAIVAGPEAARALPSADQVQRDAERP